MKRFAEELASLRKVATDMGRLTTTMVQAVVARVTAAEDGSRSTNLLEDETRLDRMELEVDARAFHLLSVYSPVARDLRQILAIGRLSGDLERIGDQAVNIAEYIELAQDRHPLPLVDQLAVLAKAACDLLEDSLDAFFAGDAPRAQSLIAADDAIDEMDRKVLASLLGRTFSVGSVSSHSVVATLSISKSFERIADQATNICEETVYLATGEDVRHPRD